MVREEEEAEDVGLVVGNYCHDVLFRGDRVVGETLGGAASFLSNVLDPLLLCPHLVRYVAKAGTDFAYAVPRSPILSPSAPTTLFHALFPPDSGAPGKPHGDRVLRRVRSCDPILPSDLPPGRSFEFGLAAAVAGEIPLETLASMLDLCRLVFVDAQGLLRSFEEIDGAVGLVPLKDTPFAPLLPRVAVLKASADEAPFVGVDEARRSGCCVIVTEGRDGCRVFWTDGEVHVPPFPAVQIDPTGAGDSFLGGFVAGLVWGLPVPDAALLGNFFGALTVAQIGIPKFDKRMLQYVKQELERRTSHCVGSCGRNIALNFQKSEMYEEFREALIEASKLTCMYSSTDLHNDHDKK